MIKEINNKLNKNDNSIIFTTNITRRSRRDARVKISRREASPQQIEEDDIKIRELN